MGLRSLYIVFETKLLSSVGFIYNTILRPTRYSLQFNSTRHLKITADAMHGCQMVQTHPEGSCMPYATPPPANYHKLSSQESMLVRLFQHAHAYS